MFNEEKAKAALSLLIEVLKVDASIFSELGYKTFKGK